MFSRVRLINIICWNCFHGCISWAMHLISKIRIYWVFKLVNNAFKRDTLIPIWLSYLLMNNYFRKCGKMSEILQKTFNVLVGSGEGVGWGSPTSSNPHSLSGSLAATLRQLALAPLKEEKELCRVQVRFSHLSFKN